MILFDSIDYPSSREISRRYEGLDKAAYFTVSPRIVPAGKKSRITICSNDPGVHLEGTYLLLVSPYYEYPYVPFQANLDKTTEIVAENGILSFEYDFFCEQLYRIVIGQKNEKGLGVLLKTSVYALEEDLLHLVPLIGDFHCHTIHSDGFDTPDAVRRAAMRLGLDFIAVTDHNSYMGSVEAALIAKEKRLPITVIHGEEYSSTFTNMHVISLGASAPLDEKYYCLEPAGEYAGKSAFELTIQLCQRIKENGGVSVLCHPLWKPLLPSGYRIDVPMSLVRALMEANVFDAIEVVGGSPAEDSMTSLMQYMWATSFGATPDRVAYLGSTDSHTYTIDAICGKHFTLVLAESNTPKAIVGAVEKKRSVAIEIIDSHNAMCYGTPRLCMFAQFYVKEILQKIE